MEHDPEEHFKNSLIAALRAKAKDGTRTKIALLREVFDEVEEARKMGVRHKQIVELLASKGLVFDLRTYLVTRHRIAKERGREQKENQKEEKPAREKVVTVAETPAKTRPAKGGVTEAMQATAKNIGKRKSILKTDKGIFGDLDPPAVEGVVDLKQK